MAKYVDVNKLLADDLTYTLPDSCGKASGRVVVFIDDIEKMPTANVAEVKHAEWIDRGDCSCSCSNCSKIRIGNSRQAIIEYDLAHFCEFCGAKMDKNRT